MNSELIICTKNRAADLQVCLESIQQQDVLPKRIIIVDASETQETNELSIKYQSMLSILYLKSIPNLARQRNFGVKHLLVDTEIVHFIDDDVILEKLYFAAIEKLFQNNDVEIIGGVGGVIISNNPKKISIWRKMFFLDSSKRAVILPSFRPSSISDPKTDITAECLGGFSMSYRKIIFNTFEFDNNLQGYSLGEDIDFSYRVSRRYSLVITPNAKLIHTQSETERQSSKDWYRSEAVHRYYYVRKNLHGIKFLCAFWWSIIGSILIHSSRSIIFMSRSNLDNTMGVLLGVLDIITNNHYLLLALRSQREP